MIEEALFDAEEKMEKAVAVARDDLSSIRTGRANPGMFSRIVIDYYGSPTPITQLSSINVPEARMIIIKPYEVAQLRPIEEAKKDIVFVFLQMREPYATASEWLKKQHLDLPLADSGSRNESDEQLRLGDNTRIVDRDIARTFPSTYVLDKRGLIIFSHTGAVHDWPQYKAFLRHAATHSGK